MAEKKQRCRLGPCAHDGTFQAEFHGVSPAGIRFSLMNLDGSSYAAPGGSVSAGAEFRWQVHCDYPGMPLEGTYTLALSREMVSLAACSHKSFRFALYDEAGELLAIQKVSSSGLDVNRAEDYPDPDRAQAFIYGRDGPALRQSHESSETEAPRPPEKTEAAEKTAAAERTASGENTEAASTPSAPEYSAPRVPPEKVSAAIPEGVSGIAPEAAFRPPELEEPYERTLRTGGYKEPSALSFISFFDLAILVIVLFLVALVIFSVT